MNYLIIVSPPSPPSASTTVRNYVAKAPQGNGTDISKVSVFDLENKIVAYSGTFPEGVRSVVSQWGQIFVLANDGKVSIPITAYCYNSGQKLMIHSCPDLKRNQQA